MLRLKPYTSAKGQRKPYSSIQPKTTDRDIPTRRVNPAEHYALQCARRDSPTPSTSQQGINDLLQQNFLNVSVSTGSQVRKRKPVARLNKSIIKQVNHALSRRDSNVVNIVPMTVAKHTQNEPDDVQKQQVNIASFLCTPSVSMNYSVLNLSIDRSGRTPLVAPRPQQQQQQHAAIARDIFTGASPSPIHSRTPVLRSHAAASFRGQLPDTKTSKDEKKQKTIDTTFAKQKLNRSITSSARKLQKKKIKKKQTKKARQKEAKLNAKDKPRKKENKQEEEEHQRKRKQQTSSRIDAFSGLFHGHR